MEFTTFLRDLDAALADLPPEETARIRDFYSELYFDALENGKSEEAAVAGLGDIGDIREKALAELGQSEEEADTQPFRSGDGSVCSSPYGVPPKESHAGRILFWCLFPFILMIGVPLAAAAAVLYLAAWLLLASLWLVAGSLALAFLWGIASGFYMMTVSIPAGLFQLGTAVFAGGLGILFGVASLVLCRLLARASAAMFRGLHSLFGKRRSAALPATAADIH